MTQASGFQKAVRQNVHIKLAIAAPSGGGKTYSALLIAKGLGGRIAVIDSENGSASLYAGMPEIPPFDTLQLHAPFHTEKYLKALAMAVQAGYDVVIIDSGTHQWSGEGGIMDRMDKEKLAKPQANSYTMWAKFTPEHEKFKQAIVQAPIHIIMTLRSKQEYVLSDEGGKKVPRKVGMAPIQRDQFEYEFSVVFELNQEHIATVSKDRTGLFDGKVFTPSVDTGLALVKWLEGGAPLSAAPVTGSTPSQPSPIPTVPDPTKVSATGITMNDVNTLRDLASARLWIEKAVVTYTEARWGTAKIGDLTREQYNELLETVRSSTHTEALAALGKGTARDTQTPTGSTLPAHDPNFDKALEGQGGLPV